MNNKGLISLKNPFSSKIVASKKKIERIGAMELLPGLLNQTVHVIEISKLNIKTFNNLRLIKDDNKKLIPKDSKKYNTQKKVIEI
tara:strand:- start:2097 stop:2351 length:255 start_codon:yes stop_codon:yes gene_type:complete